MGKEVANLAPWPREPALVDVRSGLRNFPLRRLISGGYPLSIIENVVPCDVSEFMRDQGFGLFRRQSHHRARGRQNIRREKSERAGNIDPLQASEQNFLADTHLRRKPLHMVYAFCAK